MSRYSLLPNCADWYPQFLLFKLPWAELDKEEESLTRDPLSGLGCNSVHDDWFGGKITFAAKLLQREQSSKRSNTMPEYYLELETPELGASTRFMRRWGSRRFLRVRIPESIIHQSDAR
jgi:RNA-dependent RNA polymerase